MKAFSFILFWCISFQIYAQKNNSFVVAVDVQNKPIRELFGQIEREVPLKFSYNTKLINADSLITYKSEQPIKKIISELFHKKIQAKYIGSYIVLVQSKKSDKEMAKIQSEVVHFTGTVLNGRTKAPVKNASVYEVNSRISVLSNDSGSFSIDLENGNAKNFNIAKTGFRDTLISINVKEQNNIEILLVPLTSAIEVNAKSVEEITLEENSGFVLKMVPSEGLIATVNLQNIQERRIAQVSVVPTVGTNMKASGVIENNFSLNVFGGYNGGVNGLEIGSFFNILTKDMLGVQIAGFSNVVDGKTSGVQIAGLINKCKENFIGLQIGGISNFLSDSITGVQISGISNIVNGTVSGLQIVGIHNHNTQSLNGMQLAGIINWTQDSLQGFQLAGINNTVVGNTRGLQLAAIHNLTSKNLSGAQISAISNQTLGKMNGFQFSLVNYAKQNNGFQLGLINVADSSNGISIGLFNYIRNGYHPIEVFGNEVLYTNLAFKSGVDYFYTTYTAGFRPSDPKIFGLGFGVGTKINTWKWLSISLDATATFVNEEELTTNYNGELNLLNRLDLTLDFNLGKFSFIAGPALNVHVSQLGHEETGAFTSNLAINPFYTEIQNNTQIQSWIGGKFGFRYSF